MRIFMFQNERLLTAGLFALLTANVANAGSVVLGPIYDPYGNENLYVVSRESWTQAESDAQALGGNLITIHSANENQFIVNDVLQNFTSSGGPNLSHVPLWIGLYDPDTGDGSDGQHAADFRWIDGSPSTYRNWAPGEPNNTSPGEYYGTINWHLAAGSGVPGSWNDTPVGGTQGLGSGNANGPYYGIIAVSVVPEPSSFTLFVVGGIGLGLIKCGRCFSLSKT
jgi:Lectin C-type domain